MAERPTDGRQGLPARVLVFLAGGVFCCLCSGCFCRGMPLMEAIEADNVRCCRAAIEKEGVDPTAAIQGPDREEPMPPLLWAIYWDSEKVARYLIQEVGIAVDKPWTDHESPLNMAAVSEDTGLVRLLLDHGANPVAQGPVDMMSPLLRAAFAGRHEVVDAMLSHEHANVDVNAHARQHGATALHGAAATRRQQVVRVLLKHGADINATNNGGMTPLMMARDPIHKEMARVLLDAGAAVNQRDANGRTAMHWAARNGAWRVLLLLREAGGDMNLRDKDGTSPIEYLRGFLVDWQAAQHQDVPPGPGSDPRHESTQE